jgi:hypothetical protein
MCRIAGNELKTLTFSPLRRLNLQEVSAAKRTAFKNVPSETAPLATATDL